jgi:membrane protease YdiL (CAAX protease family)
MKLTDMKIEIDFRNKYQYLIGIAIALGLSVVIAVIPALCGFSLIGNHADFSWLVLIYDLFCYLLIIGPVEEFIFRVYLQDTFVSFFEKNKWLGIVIASLLFGLWHIINGSIIQVLFTFGIGLVFGFAKYRIKNCGYVGVAFGHGLYDFLNTLPRLYIATCLPRSLTMTAAEPPGTAPIFLSSCTMQS